MSRDFGIFMPKHLAEEWCVNSNEKYPFYDIVLFIAILSNVLFMSIAIIIIRTKKTSRKNSQILHKVMQLPVDEEKERSYTILEEME